MLKLFTGFCLLICIFELLPEHKCHCISRTNSKLAMDADVPLLTQLIPFKEAQNGIELTEYKSYRKI